MWRLFPKTGLVAGLISLTVVSPAAAGPLSFDAELSAAMPIGQPQRDRFGPGAMPALGIYGQPASGLWLGGRVRGGMLSDAEPMDEAGDDRLADPGAAGLISGALAMRIEPGRWWSESRDRRLWLEVAGGLALTGPDLRPTYELALGWRFDLGRVSVGPVARYVMVQQLADPLDDRSAHLGLIGIELGSGTSPGRDQPPRITVDPVFVPDPLPPAPPRPVVVAVDSDRIVDVDARCPLAVPDQDEGCSLPGEVVTVGDRIILDERVLFDDNRARVKSRARPILEAIVAGWRAHREWRTIRVEGHADLRGPEDYNQWLSQLRAERVREALVELGIPAEIISVRGFGEARPRADGRDTTAHQRNRRVEFVIETGAERDE